MRTVIAHYHIYKNSGTTFDALLTQNYGDKHLLFDGPFPIFIVDQKRFHEIVRWKSDIIAFSSHQIRLPVPASLDFRVLPVVFVRHPLLRSLSMYRYKKKIKDGSFLSVIAQKKTFDKWVGHCLSDLKGISHISNSQTGMLGAAYSLEPLSRFRDNVLERDLDQALRNISTVELLARTEFFAQDVKKFQGILMNYGIKFKYQEVKPKNTTSSNIGASLNERLDNVRAQLSEKNYERLVNANKQDLYLFEYASNKINN